MNVIAVSTVFDQPDSYIAIDYNSTEKYYNVYKGKHCTSFSKNEYQQALQYFYSCIQEQIQTYLNGSNLMYSTY